MYSRDAGNPQVIAMPRLRTRDREPTQDFLGGPQDIDAEGRADPPETAS